MKRGNKKGAIAPRIYNMSLSFQKGEFSGF